MDNSMQYSDAARASDEACGLPLVPLTEIFVDHNFNCRGRVRPHDVIELANDIAQKGLQQPIIIRHLRDDEIDLKERGFKYKVIAGHRRYTAYKFLVSGAEAIPCIIKPSNISLFDEHDINAIENIQSEQLNYLQEAHALRHYWTRGISAEQVAAKFSKSVGWVYARFHILEHPEDIQRMIGQELITISESEKLFAVADPIEKIRAAQTLADRRLSRGDKETKLPALKKIEKAETKKHRTKTEMQDMMQHLRSVLKKARDKKVESVLVSDLISHQGNGIYTSCLAWASGELSSEEFHEEIEVFCNLFDLPYEHPDFGKLLTEAHTI